MTYTILINLIGGNWMPFVQNDKASDFISDNMIKELKKELGI